MDKLNLLSLTDETVEEAIDAAITAALQETVTEIANDKTLHDTHKDPWRIGRHCKVKVENMLGVELDEESGEWLESLTYRELKDAGAYTTPKARKLLIREFYLGTRDALNSERWRQIVDMLWDYGYFANIDVNDVLSERDWGNYSDAIIKCHGLTVGWDTHLINDWARIGIDSEWNKVSDATVLLYWPGVDNMGKRRWKKLYTKLDSLLSPKAKDHKRFVKHWDTCYNEYQIDMEPRYGKDA